MSVRRLASVQPESYAFSKGAMAEAKKWIAKYPKGRQASALIPVLWIVQKDNGGWISEPALRAIGELLDMPYIRVYEVATFYTMFNLEPVGEHFIQLCGTTPCWLRGADDLKEVCRKRIGGQNKVTADGKFSWLEVECLGACTNAPMVQINDDFYEDLTAETFEAILDDLAAGKQPKIGPQNGRFASEPVEGQKALKTTPWTKSSPSSKAGQAKDQTPVKKSRPKGPAAKPDAASEAAKKPSGKKPRIMKAPRKAGKDDLKKIKGVGPKIEGILNELGVFHFDQIAKWGTDEIAWVDDYISFNGRIERDDWIGQAKTLAGDK